MSDPPDSDAALAARSISGDKTAFARLARRHGPRLARTVRALGVRTSDVEDVVQSALLATWRNLADYDPRQSFLAWSGAIAANKARDWRRFAKVRRLWFGASELDAPEAQGAPDDRTGAAAFERHLELKWVRAAIAKLPEAQRVALILVSVTGLTAPEAAATLGISLKAVETRIARARQTLNAGRDERTFSDTPL